MDEVLLTLRDQLWQSGEISIAGLVRMDRALGLDTYKDSTDDDGGVLPATGSE